MSAADPTSDRFDAIVVGAGPAGETVASRLGDQGLATALIERELIGGECAYWACIPSKTLLRPPEVRAEAARVQGISTPDQRWEQVVPYRDFMIRELDDTDELKSYEERGIAVFKGSASFRGPHQLAVDDHVLTGERIVIATGSETAVPPITGLSEAGFWTNREATTLRELPDSVVVLGGGPVGIELAQLLRRFGAEVHLLETSDRLLAREEPRVSELLLDAIRQSGVHVHLEAEASSITRTDGLRIVRFGTDEVGGEKLIVASGRRPRVDGLGLERAGLEIGGSGIKIDERCRAGEGIWAVGDVTGAMPFTHVAMYQARVASADIAGEHVRADYGAVPRVVFCDPEVAAVGLTEEQAVEAGIEVATARIQLRDVLARPWTYESNPRGELAVLADRARRVLVGAWAVAPLASEWIHYAALAIKAQIPLDVLGDTVAQFPTYTEGYLKAIEQLEL